MNENRPIKLSISTESEKLSIKLPASDCNVLFNTLVKDAINFEPVKQEIKRAIQSGDVHEEIIPRVPIRQEEKPTIMLQEYTGFLYIRCAKCGNEYGFCAKLPISESRCRRCGEKTALENLHTVYFTCECGKRFKYLTNITDPMFDIACIECGTPNTIFRNPKTGDYNDNKERKA